MTENQRKKLEAANKGELKNEGILAGSYEYTNEKKKGTKKPKTKKTWLDKLFE
jgi:hypothetical protein